MLGSAPLPPAGPLHSPGLCLSSCCGGRKSAGNGTIWRCSQLPGELMLFAFSWCDLNICADTWEIPAGFSCEGAVVLLLGLHWNRDPRGVPGCTTAGALQTEGVRSGGAGWRCWVHSGSLSVSEATL